MPTPLSTREIQRKTARQAKFEKRLKSNLESVKTFPSDHKRATQVITTLTKPRVSPNGAFEKPILSFYKAKKLVGHVRETP